MTQEAARNQPLIECDMNKQPLAAHLSPRQQPQKTQQQQQIPKIAYAQLNPDETHLVIAQFAEEEGQYFYVAMKSKVEQFEKLQVIGLNWILWLS